MINVIIADDHRLLAESLRIVLGIDDNINILAVVSTGKEACEKSIELKPDVILMDIKMPELGGIEAMHLIKDNCPDTRVIMLTSYEDGKNIFNSFIKGADGYILKDTPPDKLKSVIKLVNEGFFVMGAGVKSTLTDEFMQANAVGISDVTISLKPDDIELIRLICEGKSNGEIAKQLGYAEGTVKNKITRLQEITQVESRAQLVMYALKNNLA